MTKLPDPPDYREILEYLLSDLKDILNEPHATDWSKEFMVENLINRYNFFLENPKAFEGAKKIVAMEKGEVK